jgi:geranylgeranyl diphosphate synthase type II
MAIEMIHTYSLIHDDLPAMDNDELRRGKPACHVAYDEAAAILAGDGLLTLAFETASHPQLMGHHNPAVVLKVIQKLAQAAGYNGMVDGQMRDIQSEGIAIDLNELEYLHQRKTGAIIEASVYTGGALGGATKRELRHFEQYARHIGIAYQVIDDVLNVEGDPAKMGKATGTDVRLGKSTYPALLGMQASKAYAQKKIEEALNALAIFDKKADLLRALARYMLTRQY